MSTFLDALAEHGVPGVHLGVSEHNTGARAFYDKTGFRRVGPSGGLIYLGRSIPPAARRKRPMWQTGVLAEIEAAALAHGAISVRAVGSVAAGAVDAWSDLDAMIVVPDGQTAEFWPGMNWLPDLGEIAFRSSGRFPRPTAVRTGLLLADGRKIDVTVVEEYRVAEHLAMLADLCPAANGTDGSTLDNIASRVAFDAVTAIGRSARGERLLATQLALGLYVRCLDAAMAIRDLATDTCVHPGPTEHDGLVDLIPPTPGRPEPSDVLGMISAALDCFEQILTHSPARPVFPRGVLDRLINQAEHNGVSRREALRSHDD
jgi:hypothetical protein